MSTTVHLPKALLEKLDLRAEEQGVSRNRYINRDARGQNP
ncbi:MAG TPA: ribbon-helix-helix protein, CopG family [Vicinamibacteria bacterium]|nr:ribbon-helix-helix protein, CopG family [Vicinamibacteria bacterium]